MKGKFKIEKGIPLPPLTDKREGRAGMTAAMRNLKVGDSVFIEGYDLSLNASVRSASRQAGIKVATRKAEKDGIQGLRVWRLE